MNDRAPRFLPKELIIGVPEVDAQHEALFARLVFLKELCLETKHLPLEQAEGLLAALQEHYATEECLAAGNDIDFSEHARQHEMMLRAVGKTLMEVVAGRANIFSLLRYLDYWFERHIAEEDRLLGLAADSPRPALPGGLRRESARSQEDPVPA